MDSPTTMGAGTSNTVGKKKGGRPTKKRSQEGVEQEREQDRAVDSGEEPQEEPNQDTQERGRTVKFVKLKMPDFSGKKGKDPQVYVQAFESWAEYRELPKGEWRECFPQTLKGPAQKWYFNYPPDNLETYKQLAKALIKRFKEEQSDEDLLKALGKIKQKKMSVHQFVENIKDLVRQLASPPSNKSLRAWFLNGTSLRNLTGSEITNPTKTFEELVERALKMEKRLIRQQNLVSETERAPAAVVQALVLQNHRILRNLLTVWITRQSTKN